jgi:hypothetical protein
MSIRSRLAIAVGFVLLVTLFALGVSTVRSTRTILIDNVEQKILTSIAEFQRPGGGLDLNDIGRPSPSYLDNPVAVVVMLYDGTTSYSPSGYAESPDNPPNVPDLDSATFDKLTVRFGTISSEDGKLHYRARIAPVRQGGAQVGWALLAAPLDDVQATVASLVRKLIISGVMALVVAIAASCSGFGHRSAYGNRAARNGVERDAGAYRAFIESPGRKRGTIAAIRGRCGARIAHAFDLVARVCRTLPAGCIANSRCRVQRDGTD